jgi:L-alanine-DL-glutamate epimerase-like enolase superfamily enzyme
MVRHLVDVAAAPLDVPLREPFVIATARMEATRAALVRVTLEDAASGRRATGLGEAAALPPVTAEDQPALLHAVGSAAPGLRGRALARLADAAPLLDAAFPDRPVTRAGVETALLDAWARLDGTSVCGLLGGPAVPPPVETDMTLPIAPPAHMAELAVAHRAAGFRCFKVKVGRDPAADRAALVAVHAAVPDARFRLDANCGYDAATALALLEACAAHGLVVECFEQPCGRDDLAGMAAVAAGTDVPVVADESVRTLADLDRVLAARAADAVNLKLVKMGGPLATLAIGRAARAAGLRIMAGAMVETRLGLVAMAHVVGALGGVDFVDLDTAFLLAGDPFAGGWAADGAVLRFGPGAGLDVAVAP